MTDYVVCHHKGRSGRSVFEWRVYAVYSHHSRRITIQLVKYRTREGAERAAEVYRENATRIALKSASRKAGDWPLPNRADASEMHGPPTHREE